MIEQINKMFQFFWTHGIIKEINDFYNIFQNKVYYLFLLLFFPNNI